jgi:hypothetical protein
MRLKWIGTALLVVTLGVPGSAQVSIYVEVAPPPIRYERIEPAPSPDYCWVDGYWAPVGHHYRWIAGHWERPPYPGAYWSHPHYDHYDRGWKYHEGHWDHEDHDRDHERDHDSGHGHDHGDHDDR